MKTLLIVMIAAAGLAGCVVVPVEPAAVYGPPAVVVSPGHYHHGHRYWRHRNWR